MPAIPYKVSAEISAALNFHFQFYDAVWDVLVGMDGLGLFLQFWVALEKESTEKLSLKAKKKKEKDNPLPNPQAAYCVLRHIIFRTVQFHKIMEFVRVKEIIEGLPTIGIAGAPFKERVIKETLKYLASSGILLKINLPKTEAVTPLYGVNLFTFLSFLNHQWRDAIENINNDYEEPEAKSVKALRAQKYLSALIQYLQKYKSVFKYIGKFKGPIENVNLFCRKLLNICPDGNIKCGIEYDLKESIRNSRVRVKRKGWEACSS